MATAPLPDTLDGLTLFERPSENETGRIVYQGREYPSFDHTAHEYWLIEQAGPSDWRLVQAVATFERGEGYDRHVERLVDTYRSNKEAADDLDTHLGELTGDVVQRVHDDGSIRFEPSFTKEEAGYVESTDPDYDSHHSLCQSCVHYISGGGCHLVQGEIDPFDYCERFYADYGAFAHEHGDEAEVNFEMMGGDFDWSPETVDDFVDEIEHRLEQAVRGLTVEDEGSEVEELLDLPPFDKMRRLTQPKPGDEWPGAWHVFETQLTDLPSWENDEIEPRQVIRVAPQGGGPYGFVHIGGDEEWRGLTVHELHDAIVRYMADHSG